MPQGRPPEGSALVDRLEAPDEEKRRAREILAVLSRERTVEEACRELGIGRARYYQLLGQFLGRGTAGRAPRPPGRPPAAPPTPEAVRIRELEARAAELEIALRAAEVREELALVFPWYRRRQLGGEKKRRGRGARR